MPSAISRILRKLKPGEHDASGDESSHNGSPRSSLDFTNGAGRQSEDSRSSSTMDESIGSHSTLKAARIEIVDKLHLRAVTTKRSSLSVDNADGEGRINGDGELMSKNQERKHEKHMLAQEKKRENERRLMELQKKKEEADERARREETPEQRARYGEFPINAYAGEWKHEPKVQFLEISPRDIGKEIIFTARVHHTRKMGSKLVFFVFRQQVTTIQGVLQEHGNITHHMVYWAEHIPSESIVHVKGVVQEPKAKEGEIKGTTIHDIEISVHGIHIISKMTGHLPFTVAEAEISRNEVEDEDDQRVVVSDRTRLTNRVVDLRTTCSQAIFRIQSGVCGLFRSHLDSQGFIEIHTPKLQGGATESGASVFKLDYFGRPAFLAQSPQLAKQMAISADFKRVYEIGAVFRAENSNTHRHLTEYTGLDLEMAIDEHYHEALNVIDRTFKHIFKGVYQNYGREIEAVKHHFPHEDLVWLDQTPIIPFRQAIKLLNDSGHRQENGEPLPEDEDLGTRDEIRLGELIKEHFETDYYILDKFPASARPFYTMPDPNNGDYTNSFDIFLRGQEILSGGQRVHDAHTLKEQMQKKKVDPDTLEEYVQAFDWAAPPHAGGGIGLERMLMLLLKLGDIRHASLWPRDPKSLPAKPVVKQLRHPEASTLHPPWEGEVNDDAHKEFQPLEKLIANYGDASNTSWLEPRTQIWRDFATGAAVGFVPNDSGFAITVGDPLCHASQYTKIITSYLHWLKKEQGYKPLWLLCGQAVEEILATQHNWRSLSVVAEQRVDLSENSAAADKEVQRKIRHAQKEGVKIHDIPFDEPVPDDIKPKIDARIQDWLSNRKGKQVHLTNIHPWQDEAHRQYHYATDSEGTICALVIMAQLSPDHGWQLKFSLDFPSAPSGTIEYIVTHALEYLANMGETNVTFGGGATQTFTPGHNLNGAKAKVLAKAYKAIATELKLTAKSEFREKLGAKQDPIYICYPPHGLGPRGVRAIMSFFEDEDRE